MVLGCRARAGRVLARRLTSPTAAVLLLSMPLIVNPHHHNPP